MPTHYETLGVANTATQGEIKSAYRALAKQHHPDAGGDQAKFSEISAAYDAIKDAKSREKYDDELLYANAKPWHNTSPDETFKNAEHFRNIFNGQFGFGFSPIHRNATTQISMHVTVLSTLESQQKSLNITIKGVEKKVDFVIPEGVVTGSIIHLPGVGDQTHKELPPGDIIITIQVSIDTMWYRDGYDINKVVLIDALDLITGCKHITSRPNGEQIEVNIPAGTQIGTRLSTTQDGWINPQGSKGKMILVIDARIPVLPESQLEMIRESRNQLDKNQISQ